eukprot:1111809-Amphidinium_carterae.1
MDGLAAMSLREGFLCESVWNIFLHFVGCASRGTLGAQTHPPPEEVALGASCAVREANEEGIKKNT